MCAENNIPRRVQAAFDLLRQERPGLEITKPLTRSAAPDGSNVEFECSLSVPANDSLMPTTTCVRVVLNDAFPYSSIEIFPISEEMRGFPHQDAETGKLCLHEDRRAAWSERRLLTFLAWAEEWLADAAHGRLLVDGDPYELPDLRRKKVETRPCFSGLLLFDESAASLPTWKAHIGRSGSVELAVLTSPSALAALRFCTNDGQEIRKAGFTPTFLKGAEQITGRWVVVKNALYFRNRPPQTYSELLELLQRHIENVDSLLRDAWKVGGKDISIFMVGWPVPATMGKPPVRIHWQSLVFKSFDFYKKNSSGRSSKKTKALASWPDMTSKQLADLPWIPSENVSRMDLHARGLLGDALCGLRVGLVGCGAVGCQVAEILARGGVTYLHLFDNDVVQYGNLCRHTLAGPDVGRMKAPQLAGRLATVSPLAEIVGHSVRMPPASETEQCRHALAALRECDLLIDCTASEGTGLWLSEMAQNDCKRMATMFVDFNAEHLTLCVSGRNTACSKVERKLYEQIHANETPVDADRYFREPTKDELCLPNVGCWHPTFPAKLVDIQPLVTLAVKMLDDILARPLRCDGDARILRRNEGAAASTKGVIEVAWQGEYR